MSSIPEEFLNSLNNTPGFNRTKFVESHKDGKTPVSIRINPLKNAHAPFSVSGKVKWANEAYYLTERPVFTADPLFHAGCYYVQEASSMFIEFILKQTIDFGKEIKALDLCGAPGGKSTLINSLLTDESLLVANETVKGRSDILVQNLVKWGRHNFVVTNSEPKAFSEIPNYFDLIVVDAPCSGSGLFRKTPEAIKEWSMEHVESCSLRQQKILSDVLPSLKSGGVLVYSTCSFSEQENEMVVKKLLEEEAMELLRIKVPDDWGITDTGFGYRFYPYNTEGEGFFCAVLQKTWDDGRNLKKTKLQVQKVSENESKVLKEFVNLNENTGLYNTNGLKIMNNNTLSFIQQVGSQVYFRSAGVNLGEIKQGKLIPNHALALFTGLRNEVEKLELDLKEALNYLKRENISIQNQSQGLKLITHQGFGLGWAKVLQNRINNYLPQNFTIFNKEIGN